MPMAAAMGEAETSAGRAQATTRRSTCRSRRSARSAPTARRAATGSSGRCRSTRLRPTPRRASVGLLQGECDQARLGELLDRVAHPFAPDTAVLDTPERHLIDAEMGALVDHHAAHLDALRQV